MKKLFMGFLLSIGFMVMHSTAVYGEPTEEKDICRVRPVLEGESLKSISESVYGTDAYADDIYEMNKDILGNNRENLEVGTMLVIPDMDGLWDDWEWCYEQVITSQYDMELPHYMDENAGYEITDYFFYYDKEGKGEQFLISYPQLRYKDGSDMSYVNELIEKEAMHSADWMMIHISDGIKEKCENGEDGYTYSRIYSQVTYEITYLDENLLSVVFQDHYFTGHFAAEYIAMRALTINLKTGQVYKNNDLWEDINGVAESYRTKMMECTRREGDDVRMYEEFMTVELIAEAMKTDGYYEQRYECEPFLTRAGMGMALSYRVSGETYLTRGWTWVQSQPEEIAEYQKASDLWKLWECKVHVEEKYFNSLKGN